ncbi:unnamed protein product, partial [Amoebophrya sp. A25]
VTSIAHPSGKWKKVFLKLLERAERVQWFAGGIEVSTNPDFDKTQPLITEVGTFVAPFLVRVLLGTPCDEHAEYYPKESDTRPSDIRTSHKNLMNRFASQKSEAIRKIRFFALDENDEVVEGSDKKKKDTYVA